MNGINLSDYSLWVPPPPVGYWIMGPLKTPNGDVRWQTAVRPKWIVRVLAKLMLDCEWLPYPEKASDK